MYPEYIKSLLTPLKIPLSAAKLQDLFEPEFSEIGSNKKVLEDQIVYFFTEYIKDTKKVILAIHLWGIGL